MHAHTYVYTYIYIMWAHTVKSCSRLQQTGLQRTRNGFGVGGNDLLWPRVCGRGPVYDCQGPHDIRLEPRVRLSHLYHVTRGALPKTWEYVHLSAGLEVVFDLRSTLYQIPPLNMNI